MAGWSQNLITYQNSSEWGFKYLMSKKEIEGSKQDYIIQLNLQVRSQNESSTLSNTFQLQTLHCFLQKICNKGAEFEPEFLENNVYHTDGLIQSKCKTVSIMTKSK